MNLYFVSYRFCAEQMELEIKWFSNEVDAEIFYQAAINYMTYVNRGMIEAVKLTRGIGND